MTEIAYREGDGAFRLSLPPGWSFERDEEGGLLLSRADGRGLLHLLPFERDPEEETDPADEIYAFLEDQEIEIEEDEVEDLDLVGRGSLAVCEYLAEEEGETVYWMIGVATAPGQLLFASYSCPAGEEEAEQEAVREILAGVVFLDRGS